MEIREIWVDGYLVGVDWRTARTVYVLARYNETKLAPLDYDKWPREVVLQARRALLA